MVFYEDLLDNILNREDMPNIIIYGHKSVTIKKEILINKLNSKYTIKNKKIDIIKDIEYIHTNIYYEFNIKQLNNKNLDTFLEIISNIINSNNYFTNLKNKIIIFNNFIVCKKIQNILRVIIEKYRITTLFILISDKYTNIIEPLRSRCIGIRIPGLNRSDKRKIIYKNVNYKETTPKFYDNMYLYNCKEDIDISSKLKLSYDKGFIDPYQKISKEIMNLYLNNFNINSLKKIKEISFVIVKYINISNFYCSLLSLIISDNKIRDKIKYKIIKLFSDSQYNYIKSYRSIIVIEGLLLNIFNLLSSQEEYT